MAAQRAVEPKADLFYILVYLTKENQPPRFFVLTSAEAMRERAAYKEHIESTSDRYRESLGGFNWSQALQYEDKWDVLPK